MYIPRPAKLLFTIDDGWNKFLEKFGDSISPWTKLSVERMLACGTCAMVLLLIPGLFTFPLLLPEL
ncbi:TPA: hypothetical protein ACJXM5_004214 [Salmonella enterica subsp. enterica serovar Virchow]|nr:hypothetical protein [Salmonella enterica]